MWKTITKAVLLATYLLALASLAWPLPFDLGAPVRRLTLIVLIVHAVELVLAFRHVRSYRGPLAVSVLLTLLFGLLHWKPLADASRQRPPQA